MGMALQRKGVVLFLMLSCLISSSYSYQFTIGGKDGWVPNPSESYNQWSQRMRFQIGDTVLFKYKQGSDSVLEVNKDDYDKCNTQNPIMKMEDGNSIFKFDRSGPFYFISGNKDNCDKGQKVQIVVISIRGKTPPATPPAPNTPPPSATTPAAAPPKGSSTPGTPSPNAAPPKGSSTPGTPSPSGAPTTPTTGKSPTASPPTPAGSTPTSSPAGSQLSPPSSSPTPAGSQLSPPSASPGGATTPAISPATNAPSTGSPVTSPTPATSITPSGSMSPAGGPSMSPSGSLAPGSSSMPGSMAPGPGGSSPADINSPGGAPAGPNSFAVKAFTPSAVFVLTVSLVLTIALAEFITFSL